MGTNYYLRTALGECPTCGHDRDDADDEGLHVGKASAGWVFAWRGYPPAWVPGDLTTPSGWFDYLAEVTSNRVVLVDEHGRVQDLDEFRRLVVGKRETSGPGGARSHRQTRSPELRVTHVGGDDVVFYDFC